MKQQSSERGALGRKSVVLFVLAGALGMGAALGVPTRAGAQSTAAAGPDARTVRLGPGLMTFPEIAEQLFTPERPVRCAHALRQRAAFVYLKERPREQAEQLLARGLGIAFNPAGGQSEHQGAKDKAGDKKGVVLEPNVETARREERWRRRFVQNLSALLRRRYQKRQEIAALPPDERARRRAALEAELERAEASSTEDDPSPALLAVERSNEYSNVEEQVPDYRLGGRWFRQNAAALLSSANEVLRQGRELRVYPAAQFGAEEVGEVVRRVVERFGRPNIAPDYDVLVAGLEFRREPESLTFGATAHLISSNYSFAAPCPVAQMVISLPHDYRLPLGGESGKRERRLVDDVFRGTTQTTLPLAGLGTDAVAWLEKERADTTAFRAAEAEREKAPAGAVRAAGTPNAPATPPSNSYSALVAAWSRQNDREAVMELFPLAEADWYLRGNTLRTAFLPGSGWTLRGDQGVLLVTNQLAFLDRYRSQPTASLARLIRKLQQRRDEPAAAAGPTPRPATSSPAALPAPTAPERIEYSDGLTKNDLWAIEDAPTTFWGVSLVPLDGAVPGAYLWRKMTTAQRQQLQAEGRFPLSRFSVAAIETVHDMLLPYPQSNAQLWHPASPARLRQCDLTSNLELAPGNSALTLFIYEPFRTKPKRGNAGNGDSAGRASFAP